MEKVLIDFDMSSLDSQEQFTTTGELKNERIIFFDSESNKHYVVFNNSIIEYYKKGTMDMKFIFDIHNKTLGKYKVSGNEFVFDIVTTKLENTSNSLVIEYKLLQDNEIINISKLMILYSITKED